MLENICAQLNKKIDMLYIQRIIKNEKMYLIFLSDKYGNDMDMLPLGFDSENGLEVPIDYDYDASGVNCSIPEQYNTYRNIVYDRLVESVPNAIVDDLGPYGISYAVNAIYTEYISEISISQLYAICNYMIHTIALICNEEEKTNFMSLLNNDIVSSFIRMDSSEKIAVIDGYYYVPDYLKMVFELSNELLSLAIEKKSGKAIDSEYCSELIENTKNSINDAFEKIKMEKDPMCDIDKIKALLDEVKADSEIESRYCSGLSEDITDRMKEFTEQFGFGDRQSFIGTNIKFGDEEE